jgi:HlyD family secretion protein
MRDSPWLRVRRWAARLAFLAAVAGVGYGVFRYSRSANAVAFPTAAARKGEFLALIRCRGTLSARHSVGIYTPAVPNLRIAWIAPAGDSVKSGDVIVRFDSSTAQQQLAQKEAQLKQAQATLDQAVAQSKVTIQQDQTELADANFNVEMAGAQAKLIQVQKGVIKGAEADIDKGVAEQKLKVQQATVDLHRASERSRIASLTRQRDQAQTDVDVTRGRIAQMELKAPSDGILSLRVNCSGVVTSTADCKPYKVGDNVSSGMVLGEIPDLATLDMDVKLEESDRGRVSVKQDALLHIDAIPELTISGTVTDVARLAEIRMEPPYTRSFSARAAIPHPDARLRPDMSGGMDIVVSRIPNAISIPSQALFTHEGKPTVYLSEAGHYRPAIVEVVARNPDEVAVTGIPEGSKVSLVDAEKQGQKK